MPASIPTEIDHIARQAVDSAFRVHSTLGAGLLESVYESCLEHELRKRGLTVRRQVVVPVVYDDIRFDEGFRLDLLVENMIVIEIKAAERLLPVFEAQLLTYLKLTGLRLGFLINFNVGQIKDGIRRIAL
ncbi:GxxExxY protein [Azospirillum soli]|uniref:GxxExxY protein n=1 Tax=Azospirillum soli TaxID=1304799 RepID=UPI001AE18F97|nr:GxxExxY protein [Azospirillum soli]MBP2315316.1 GxxExxY protein [Azospirillum soli]